MLSMSEATLKSLQDELIIEADSIDSITAERHMRAPAAPIIILKEKKA